MSEREDKASIASTVKYFLSHAELLTRRGWEVEALDIGEVEITISSGQKFRLTIEEVSAED